MDAIKGGSQRPVKKKPVVVEDEQPRRIIDGEKTFLIKEAVELPTQIVVKSGPNLSCIPGHVWRTRPFKWKPVTFATESEQLNSRFIEPDMQDRSLKAFLADPRTPMIYGVSGNPDDSKAKYFAAYLIAAHIKALGSTANVVWAPMYGGFDNPYMDGDKAPPTMLVLSNLTPNSTTMKLEKARDLIEKFSDIPRVVVSAGIDPMSFLTTRLYVPINGLAYFSEGLVKQRVEII